MIENCLTLRQCENVLIHEIPNVNLLGQIELSTEDLNLLSNLIRQEITPDIQQGTRFLNKEAPTCLSCFLVWMGIVGYQNGDYWAAVQEATGLADDRTYGFRHFPVACVWFSLPIYTAVDRQ